VKEESEGGKGRWKGSERGKEREEVKEESEGGKGRRKESEGGK
jgi:hypothetical protein